jgi:predicted Na+-dependent transporter
MIHVTAVMYLKQFRADSCFLEKIVVMGNVVGVAQNMECVFRVQLVKKKIKTTELEYRKSQFNENIFSSMCRSEHIIPFYGR